MLCAQYYSKIINLRFIVFNFKQFCLHFTSHFEILSIQASETDPKHRKDFSFHESGVWPLGAVYREAPSLCGEGQHHSFLHGCGQERKHDGGGAGGIQNSRG